MKSSTRGFTLIELMVVVSIIGLLSSVVLASLNSARTKAKDAAIKSSLTQIHLIMAQNFDQYGSYCELAPSVWIPQSGGCSSQFTGSFAPEARKICQNIMDNAKDDYPGLGAGYKLLVFVNPTNCTNTYSWTVQLNNGKWLCAGSSGVTAEYASYYTGLGCYQTP
jgi:prepilin-type N-terminal cleavage/methylation domain-containing protein